jgi:exoribonuclease-2
MCNVPTHDLVLVAVLLLQALVSAPPPDPDASTRLDLTHLTVYTVDDASTTEVDDGLSITTNEAGAKLLWVHVADPTRWLTPGTHTAALLAVLLECCCFHSAACRKGAS